MLSNIKKYIFCVCLIATSTLAQAGPWGCLKQIVDNNSAQISSDGITFWTQQQTLFTQAYSFSGVSLTDPGMGKWPIANNRGSDIVLNGGPAYCGCTTNWRSASYVDGICGYW
jgi:hypothetical protein